VEGKRLGEPTTTISEKFAVVSFGFCLFVFRDRGKEAKKSVVNQNNIHNITMADGVV
jgi:hypothetical protein